MPNFFVMTVDMDPPPFSDPNLDIQKGTTEILNLFHANAIHATFFVPASVAVAFPTLIKRIAGEGHEIACHGLKHDPNEAVSSLDEQYYTIKKATNTIESIIGSKPLGFRAPLFRSNTNCRIALKRNNYIYDSSIVPSPLYGNYQVLPLSKPFFLSCSNYNSECDLLEIPVSVNPFLPFPLGGAYLRILGLKWAKVGIRINSIFNTPIVFFIHPKDVIHRTSGSYWYAYRNTGCCMKRLEKIILYGKRIDVKFLKACELAELYLDKSRQ